MLQLNLWASLLTVSLNRYAVVGQATPSQETMTCIAHDEFLNYQSDYDLAYGNCTQFISGDLTLSETYTGDFSLDKVTYFGGTLSSSSSSVAAISLRNLTDIGSLVIKSNGTSFSLSLSALERVDFATFSIFSARPFELSLPHLKNVAFLNVYGNFSSVSFPDLEKATGIILNWNWYTQPGESATVDFPSLTSVGEYLSFIGNLSSISLPILAYTPSLVIGVSIPTNISLLSLTNVSKTLNAYGPIENAFFPALVNVEMLEISSTDNNETPLNIEAPKLSTIHGIKLSGPITTVNISSVTTFPELVEVDSTLKSLNCTPFKILWNGRYGVLGSDTTPHNAEQSFSCKGPPMPRKKRLGIGLGVGIPCLIAICILGWWIRLKLKWKRRLETAQVASEEALNT